MDHSASTLLPLVLPVDGIFGPGNEGYTFTFPPASLNSSIASECLLVLRSSSVISLWVGFIAVGLCFAFASCCLLHGLEQNVIK